MVAAVDDASAQIARAILVAESRTSVAAHAWDRVAAIEAVLAGDPAASQEDRDLAERSRARAAERALALREMLPKDDGASSGDEED